MKDVRERGSRIAAPQLLCSGRSALSRPLSDLRRTEPMDQPDTQSNETSATQLRMRGVRYAVWAAFAASLIALTGGMAVATAAIEPDPVCLACHTQVAIRDGHVGIPCYGCHAGSGALVRSARLIIDGSHVLRGLPRDPAEATVDRRACEGCHLDIMTGVVFADGIRVQHRTCVTREARCTDCHSDIAHGRITGDRAIAMDRCSRCHDGQAAPKDCDICHFGEPSRRDALNAWAITHGRNRHETHGMGDLTTCRICHERSDCAACHIPVPHEASWPRLHGDETLTAGEDACLACHVRELCDGCHGITMPHPSTWLPEHSTAVPVSDVEDRCKECHSDSDCQDCHAKHVHPGLRTGDAPAGRGTP